MRARRTLLATAFLAAIAMFPTAANACIIAPRPVMAFWDQAPDAEPGEVVVKLRLLRIEKPSPLQVVVFCGQPALFVFEVLEVAEGDFAPRQIYLYGSGAAHNDAQTGWLVGKPRTLYMKHILWVRDGDPPPPEYDSIEWRPPSCIGGFNCTPPAPGLFQP